MKKKVLIVEDVDEMRLFLELLVNEIKDLQVSGTAANTAQARRELGRRKPDVVLLDEILPGESSLDLLAEMREMGIPVLMMSGMENPTHEVPQGAAGRISKPGWRPTPQEKAQFAQAIRNALTAVS